MNKPKRKPVVSDAFYKLQGLVDEFIDLHETDKWHEDRVSKLEPHIVEAAVEMFYGKKVWVWINSVEDRIAKQ